MSKLGDGSRTRKLQKKLARKGAKNPQALAAWIGRKKFGQKRFAELSAMGRENALARRRSQRRVKV